MPFRVPQGVRYVQSDFFVIDKNGPFNIPVLRQVYRQAYVVTGLMTEEELETFLGCLNMHGDKATCEAYSAFIRSPISAVVPEKPG